MVCSRLGKTNCNPGPVFHCSATIWRMKITYETTNGSARESLFATKIRRNIQNHSKYITVAGYQMVKPIKLVAFSTNYTKYFSYYIETA